MSKALHISVLVAAGPHHPAAAQALHYCEALLAGKHIIKQVFFHQDGVLLGLAQTHTAPQATTVAQQWQTFVANHDIHAVLCSASAVRRGVFNEHSAQQYNVGASTIAPHFQHGGLGEWAEAIRHSHKIISF